MFKVKLSKNKGNANKLPAQLLLLLLANWRYKLLRVTKNENDKKNHKWRQSRSNNPTSIFLNGNNVGDIDGHVDYYLLTYVPTTAG